MMMSLRVSEYQIWIAGSYILAMTAYEFAARGAIVTWGIIKKRKISSTYKLHIPALHNGFLVL